MPLEAATVKTPHLEPCFQARARPGPCCCPGAAEICAHPSMPHGARSEFGPHRAYGSWCMAHPSPPSVAMAMGAGLRGGFFGGAIGRFACSRCMLYVSVPTVVCGGITKKSLLGARRPHLPRPRKGIVIGKRAPPAQVRGLVPHGGLGESGSIRLIKSTSDRRGAHAGS
jgi:hypothetical protein